MTNIIVPVQNNGVMLLPQNLANLGLNRLGNGLDSDLMTIWDTTYPVLTTFNRMCQMLGWKAYGGGTMDNQGEVIPGYITSGYRDKAIKGNRNSAHMYALAIDVFAGGVEDQANAAMIIGAKFNRVGFYPKENFIHMDLMPDAWIRKYNKAKFWLYTDKFRYFDSIEKAAEYMKSQYSLN